MSRKDWGYGEVIYVRDVYARINANMYKCKPNSDICTMDDDMYGYETEERWKAY